MEWGDQLPTLVRAAKQFGKTPQALLDMPIIPEYYEELVTHFHVLSRSRSYGYEVFTNKKGGVSTRRRPNPIDISAILEYNRVIYKILRPLDFLEVMQLLDAMFLTDAYKRN